ncbi:MAG TPA: CPBP family glutamic-type intramembrane protease [Candidatus Angelobacter sp.]|nr:CPBP family glutamic-type intramembrane protease [Candidatus Angelobacter sp.]
MEPPTPGRERDDVEFIFFNERGLRSGWRLLIFLAIIFAIFIGIGLLLRPLAGRLPQGLTPATVTLTSALEFLVVVFASWIMSRIERRNMGEYGLPLRNSDVLSRFVSGYIFWGFLPLTLLLVTLRAVHAFYFGKLALHDGQIFYWAGAWGVSFIFVALREEYLLRGYSLYTLAEGIGFWPAAVVLAALFAFLHSRNPGETRIGIIMTAFFALFAAAALRYTGNLWLAVGAHAGWDWGESYFYGVNDSGIQAPGHLLNPQTPGPAWLNGGSVGPEGSILALVVLTAMTVLVMTIYGKAKKPVLVVTKNW